MRRNVLATAMLAAGLVGCGTVVWEVRYDSPFETTNERYPMHDEGTTTCTVTTACCWA